MIEAQKNIFSVAAIRIVSFKNPAVNTPIILPGAKANSKIADEIAFISVTALDKSTDLNLYCLNKFFQLPCAFFLIL